ncbi:MAG: hypothetical protein GY910_09915 [bacterium]|nr:hypothetical protein [bacterium]
MSNWRVEKHYGFGAAKIPLRTEFHRRAEVSMADGLAAIRMELVEGGPRAVIRRLAGQAPGILLGVMLFAAFVVTLSKDRSDLSPIEMVLIETPPPIPEIIVEEEPAISIAEVKPLPPELAPLVVPSRPPPPPQRAERVAPPPPTVKPHPVSVMPRIAKIDIPEPPPSARLDRPLRERPQPVDRPRVVIDQLKPELLVATPRVENPTRVTPQPPNARRNPARLIAPAAPAFAPAPDPEPSPIATFRVATSRPTEGARPKALPGIAPAPRQLASARPPPPARPNRASPPRATVSRRPRSPVPALAAASIPTAPALVVPETMREARGLPLAESRAERRSVAKLPQAPQRPTVAPPRIASRADRSSSAPSIAPSGDRPGVAGVPLGELAACVSDREEDRLKQAVAAAVKTQEKCVSRKGTYRFVETKNLNAFLMWIDRAPSRTVEDRCTELHYALECLRSASQHAAR